MIFTETKLSGAYIIQLELYEDERGFFARMYCEREFKRLGLKRCSAQCNLSYNQKKGTLRGMHYQAPPFSEARLITCLRGAIYDVIVDLRRDSPTFTQWVAVELTSENRQMIYIPEGFAHGFQTLEDDTEVFYMMSEFYAPDYARGVRWNDPAFAIEWPAGQRILSYRDTVYSDFLEISVLASK